MDWFNNLQTAEQLFFVVAVVASILLVVQVVLLFIGMGNSGDAFDGGADGDVGGDGDVASDIQSNSTSFVEIGGLKIVTVRGVIAFFAVGGWLAFGLFASVGYWSLLIGAAGGGAFAVLLAFLMRALIGLEGKGNLEFKKAVGATGTVYLNIPEKRSGAGKIMVMIQERLVECEAMTDGEKLCDGTVIKIIGMVDGNTFLVERV
ncbi:MAG: hypothetical protein LBQ40_00275 [Clostridiales bacterium]|nr:hypothetical protein [Clostridiales bacterium]